MADASSPTKVWRGNDAGSQHARSPIPCQHEMVEAETLGRPGYRMAKSDGQRCDAPGIPRAGVVFRHDCRVADLGKPARFNHLSKTVLSAMHVGGTDSTQRLPSQSSNMVLSTVKKGPLAGDRTTRHTLNYLPKLKPKWDVHLLDEGNRAGEAGWSASALDCRTVRQRRRTSSFRLASPARKLPTRSRTAALVPRHRFPVASSRAHPQMASSALKSGL